MSKLQVEIDEENETLTELYDEKNKAEEKKQKAAIEALLVSSFGKTYFWKHQTLDVNIANNTNHVSARPYWVW